MLVSQIYFSSPYILNSRFLYVVTYLISPIFIAIKYLKLNISKMELLLFPPRCVLPRIHLLPHSLSCLICCQLPVVQVRNFGVLLDSLVPHTFHQVLAVPFRYIQNSTSFHHLHSHQHLLLGNCGSLLTHFTVFTLFSIVC